MSSALSNKKRLFTSKYEHNALIHLILALAGGFILLHSINIVILVLSDAPEKVLLEVVLPQVSLQNFETFLSRPWILFTYPWGHQGFWALLGNMLWLYVFGSVLQTLIGYKEIIPLYFFSTLISGIVYLIVSFFWKNIPGSPLIIGSFSGVIAFAAAAYTLVPKYNFYWGDRFVVPILLLIAVYLVLNLFMLLPNNASLGILMISGALVGFGYMKLLQKGYRPGFYIYRLFSKVETSVTPTSKHKYILNERKNNADDPNYIDTLLDKINQKGINSLSKEEKDALYNASQK